MWLQTLCILLFHNNFVASELALAAPVVNNTCVLPLHNSFVCMMDSALGSQSQASDDIVDTDVSDPCSVVHVRNRTLGVIYVIHIYLG